MVERCYWCRRLMLNRKRAMKTDMGKMRTREHLVPACEGGSDDWRNVTAACFRCNNVRGSMPLERWREFVEVCVRPEPGIGIEETRRRLVLWRRRGWAAFVSDAFDGRGEGLGSRARMVEAVKEVCLREGVTPWQMVEKGESGRPRRVHRFVRARRMVWWRVAEKGGVWSYNRVARAFGIDHSCVVNAMRMEEAGQ